MLENAIRAARLDVSFYATVEHDASYTGQAAAVVLAANALAAVGTWVTFRGNLVGTIVGVAVGGVIGWLIWSGITYWVGTRMFEGTADYGEMLRVLGYAQAPRALSIIPFLGLVALIWTLVASVVAVREGLDFSTGKAVATVLVGWIVLVVLTLIWGIIF